MTNADFLRDYQNFITQSLFFDQTGHFGMAASAASVRLKP
jgi:hypothetical protein